MRKFSVVCGFLYRFTVSGLGCLVSVNYFALAQAQTPTSLPGVPVIEEQVSPQPEIPEELPSVQEDVPLEVEGVSSDETEVPPPSAAIDAEAVCPELVDTDEMSFEATEIEVIGHSVMHAEIAQLVDCYVGQEIRLSDLFNLRSQITQLYINSGYITSGAFVPNNQDLTTGLITIQVVEGQIEALQVNGLNRLQEGYIRSRLARAMDPPFNQQNLEEGLQLLQLDPVLERVNAELTAGNGPGKSLLILEVEEAETFGVSLAADNYRSPSIGSRGINAGLTVTNPLGFGDSFAVSYGTTEGLNLYDVSYFLPVNGRGGTLKFRVSNSESRIIQEAFRDVGIRSDTTTLTAGFRQPLWQTPTSELAIGLDFDWKHSQSYILNDIPFSFSQGSEQGRSQVSVLRFYQDWTRRSQSRVLAARSQFSLGLGILGATTNDSGIDGQFLSWLGQFQWIEQVSPRLLILTRVGAQLTPDSLLPLERFSLGGVGTVRGYAQNQLVADNALTGSLEFRIPVSNDPNKIQLTPFLDAGVGWNNNTPNPDPSFLLSTGLGVRWVVSPNLFLRLDYGIPLITTDDAGNSLQENGLYLLVDYKPTF